MSQPNDKCPVVSFGGCDVRGDGGKVMSNWDSNVIWSNKNEKRKEQKN